jgi:hypothetical protein
LAAKAQATTARPGDAAEKLLALAMNLVDFAADNPRLLELMYESELTSPSPEAVLLKYQNAGQSALRTQLRAVRPADSHDETSIAVIALWSLIYGFASLRPQTDDPEV